ncbi:MAG: LeuA family protein [Armatimonadota bacterium]
MELLYDNNRRFMPDQHLPEQVFIWDETLRDGEQAPGVAFHLEEKKAIAKALADSGVSAIDAGMPIISDDEADAVRAIIGMELPCEIGVTVRCHEADLKVARECGVRDVYMFLSVSPLHMLCKFGMQDYEKLYERALRHVSLAQAIGFTVTFIAEDSTGAEPEELLRLVHLLHDAGIRRLIICDTAVRLASPLTTYEFFRYIIGHSPADIAFGVHCHNDLGCATANTVLAVQAGVKAATVTINGLGERAGNASLEQTVMTLEKMGVRTGVRQNALYELSRIVQRASGVHMPLHAPVIGLNAFRHESGIHAAGVLEDPRTYETIMPEEVGREREIVFGKHSGRHQLVALLDQHGVPHTPEIVEQLLAEIKQRKEQQSHLPLARMVDRLDEYYRKNFGVEAEIILARAKELMADDALYTNAA